VVGLVVGVEKADTKGRRRLSRPICGIIRSDQTTASTTAATMARPTNRRQKVTGQPPTRQTEGTGV